MKTTRAQRVQQRLMMKKVRRAINLHDRSGVNHDSILRVLHEEDVPWKVWKLRWNRGLKELRRIQKEDAERNASWGENVLTRTLVSRT